MEFSREDIQNLVEKEGYSPYCIGISILEKLGYTVLVYRGFGGGEGGTYVYADEKEQDLLYWE